MQAPWRACVRRAFLCYDIEFLCYSLHVIKGEQFPECSMRKLLLLNMLHHISKGRIKECILVMHIIV